METSATLYLIPMTLGETALERVLPSFNTAIISSLSYFIVEDIRTARRFLKKNDKSIDIDSLSFFILNEHTDPKEISSYLIPLSEGKNVGVISEAGCPVVADPGASIVAIAQERGFKVVPLIGPSSILLSLMASGFNGQSFAFHGYLPIDSTQRIKKLKWMEGNIGQNQTQIFIETPYRNQKLVDDIVKNCKDQLKLCIAINITCPDEEITTHTITEWKKLKPVMDKRPAIFLLYK